MKLLRYVTLRSVRIFAILVERPTSSDRIDPTVLSNTRCARPIADSTGCARVKEREKEKFLRNLIIELSNIITESGEKIDRRKRFGREESHDNLSITIYRNGGRIGESGAFTLHLTGDWLVLREQRNEWTRLSVRASRRARLFLN